MSYNSELNNDYKAPLNEGNKISYDKEVTIANYKKNQCFLDLEDKYCYISRLKKLCPKSQFQKSYISSLRLQYPVRGLFFSIIFSITFYFVLYSIIFTGNKNLIIFLVILYIVGTFIIQNSLIPDKFNTKIDFIKDISDILNSIAYIYKEDKDEDKKEKEIIYPGEYNVNITGIIKIPKNIYFVKIDGIQYFVDSNYDEFFKQVNYENNNLFVELERKSYSDSNDGIYKINNNCSINIFSIILCLSMLRWIQVIFSCIFPDKCLYIFPVKFITNKYDYVYLNDKTEIIIDGINITQNQDKTSFKSITSKFNKTKNKVNDKKEEINIKKEESNQKEIDKKNNINNLTSFDSIETIN